MNSNRPTLPRRLRIELKPVQIGEEQHWQWTLRDVNGRVARLKISPSYKRAVVEIGRQYPNAVIEEMQR